jgi:molybdate transport system ATP-binding protein
MIEIAVERRLGDFRLAAEFTTEAAGITALFGRSGSGKTSLVNAIAGLLRPDRGTIRIGDEILFSSERRIDLPPERRRIGYVFQDGRLFPHLSVRSNLTYGMRRRGAVGFDAVVDLLGIAHLLARRPRELSGGEKQRVAIGRALLSNPRLLLMDEPLASLDAPRKAQILPFVERLRDELKIPIVYVSHAMDEIIRLADTLVLLSEGHVAAVGSVASLTSRLDLRPLTGRYEAGAVIQAAVARQDAGDGLSELAFPGGRIVVPRVDLPHGTPVRARIRARDVSLALAAPEDISILNIFAGRIVEIADEAGAQVDVSLDIGTPAAPVALWARVTARSARHLGLAPGMPVVALVKAVALDRTSLGRLGSQRSDEEEE